MQFFSTLLAAAAAFTSINASAIRHPRAAKALTQVTAFNAGPTAAKMYIYLPANKLASAPIIVAVHYCTGTGPAYFQGSQYANLADQKGFIVIYPSSPSSGGCWDVASTASLTHNGGGDSQTIVNMVSYAVKNYGGDASRVYVTGSSSGAMMTNVLAGAYPDVFKAGSVYSGVPDGCFYVAGSKPGAATPGWNSQCAQGQVSKTAQQWGDLTRSYYPGYTGARPKMMIWHGTVDTTLTYPNYGETMKQWSNVLNVSLSSTTANTPSSGYTKTVYGSTLVGYSAANVGHTVPIHESIDMTWFGL